MTVTLYKYANKPIIVDKSSLLTDALSTTGEVPATNQDLENPVLYFTFTAEPEYNYAYINEYHRYYYITNKTWMGGNVFALTFHVDELYTYKALVQSLSGIVKYSGAGSMYKYDPRINFNVPPVRGIITPNPGTTLAPKPVNPGIPMICLRYYTTSFNNDPLASASMPNCIEVAYMNPSAYIEFMYAFIDLMVNDEGLANAISASILDVTEVFYLGTFPSQITSDNQLIFNTPAVVKLNNNSWYTFTITKTHLGTLWPNPLIYHCNGFESAYVNPGLTFQFDFINAYYWNRVSKKQLFLPHIGTDAINFDQMGIGEVMLTNLQVNVRHEPLENAYVVTYIIGSNRYYIQRKISTVSTTLSFFTDVSFNNKEGVETAKMWSIAGTAIAGIGNSIITGGLALPRSLSQGINAVSNANVELDNLRVADAMSIKATGMLGGSPDITDSLSYVHIEELTSPPAGNPSGFWTEHGLPDGEYRALSSLTGYVEMQEFEMIYNPNATWGEMDRLERMLYEGVIL